MSTRTSGLFKSRHGDLGTGKRPALPIYPSPLVVEPLPTSYDPADLMTIGEVAALLGVPTSTVRGRIRAARLRVGQLHRVTPRWSRTYYSRADLEAIRGLWSVAMTLATLALVGVALVWAQTGGLG